jgi:hypothetical protein
MQSCTKIAIPTGVEKAPNLLRIKRIRFPPSLFLPITAEIQAASADVSSFSFP